jgi:DNA helicase-2/ATP-dependent DNA helicase PcrA
MDDLRRIGATASVAELMRAVLDRSGLYERALAQDQAEGTTRAMNLGELVNATAPYGSGSAGVAAFLQDARLAGVGEADAAEDGSAEPVTLITIHNTKGLEFERVVLTGLEEGVFPLRPGDHTSDPEQADRDLEEERRLFYVGVTRSRRHLHLTACARRTVFGQRRDQQMSRFLSEIPERLLARDGASGRQGDAEDFPAGAEVYHEDYGSGVVTRRWSSAGTWFVTVRFATEHEASFAVRYSALERIRS